MKEKSVQQIEEEIAGLKARWPAHSVPPHMWQQLEDLEEELKAAKQARMDHEGIFDTGQAAKLENEGRIRELRPRELLENVAGVTAGMTCVDFGSGTGAFALPMAEIAGERGRVYAVDNSGAMQEYLRAKNPPPQLVPTAADVMRTGLEAATADVCLLAFILHEVKDPAGLVAEASRLLKAGGRLVAVDWKAELDSPGPPRNRRIGREKLEKMLGEAGLALKSYAGWTANHYAAVGEKPAGRG